VNSVFVNGVCLLLVVVVGSESSLVNVVMMSVKMLSVRWVGECWVVLFSCLCSYVVMLFGFELFERGDDGVMVLFVVMGVFFGWVVLV